MEIPKKEGLEDLLDQSLSEVDGQYSRLGGWKLAFRCFSSGSPNFFTEFSQHLMGLTVERCNASEQHG